MKAPPNAADLFVYQCDSNTEFKKHFTSRKHLEERLRLKSHCCSAHTLNVLEKYFCVCHLLCHWWSVSRPSAAHLLSNSSNMIGKPSIDQADIVSRGDGPWIETQPEHVLPSGLPKIPHVCRLITAASVPSVETLHCRLIFTLICMMWHFDPPALLSFVCSSL